MKKILLVILLSHSVYGQENFQNGSFENWSIVANYETPDHWLNLNWSSSPDAPFPISKTTDAHSGDFAVKCSSFYDPWLQMNLSGTLAYGIVDPINGISPVAFTSRPDSLTFWMKYFPQDNSNYFAVLSLTKWNPQTESTDYIGFATSQGGTTIANYTRISVPLTYISLLSPDTIVLTFQTCLNQNTPNIELYIDDIALVYNNIATDVVTLPEFALFPNPVMNELEVTSAQTTAYTIYTVDGKPMSSGLLNTGSNSFDLTWLHSGIYILKTDTGYAKQFVKS